MVFPTTLSLIHGAAPLAHFQKDWSKISQLIIPTFLYRAAGEVYHPTLTKCDKNMRCEEKLIEKTARHTLQDKRRQQTQNGQGKEYLQSAIEIPADVSTSQITPVYR